MAGADALVVGAGVVGLSAARELAARGARVTVVDADTRGGAGSRAAAGVAVPSLRLAAGTPVRALGERGRGALAEDLSRLEARAPGLRRPTGILRPVADHEERAALEDRAGDDAGALGSWVSPDELADVEPGLRQGAFAGAYLADGVAMVDTEAYVDALLDEVVDAGVNVRLAAPVAELSGDGGRWLARTPSERFRADLVVVAAGPASGVLGGLPPLPVAPQRGQMMAVRRPGSAPRHVISRRMYLAPWPRGAICVGATEEDAGAAEPTVAGTAVLASFAVKLLPALAEARVVRTWAGLRSVTPSGAPLIGWHPRAPGVLVATGLGGQGILTGALVGRMVAELADKGASPAAEPFSPAP